MNPYVSELVAALVVQRKERKIARSVIAEACNVPGYIITYVERGDIEPTLSLLLDYAEAVQHHLRWNLTGKPSVKGTHCDHWANGDGPCCRCGEPNWCPESGETPEALAQFDDRGRTCLVVSGRESPADPLPTPRYELPLPESAG